MRGQSLWRRGRRPCYKTFAPRSLDLKSEGIQLIAGDVGGGVGRFIGLKLKTVEWNPRIAPGEQNTTLIADGCRAERVEGFTDLCDPENIKDGVRR